MSARQVKRGRKPHPMAVAIGVILVALAISFYAFNEGPPLVHGYRVHALMSDANALRPKSPVRISGIGIGKVTKVSAGPGNTTRVDMDLKDSALPLHTDATIRARPRLFVEGGYYIALSPGSPSAPELKENGTIPLPQTRSAVQFSQLLSVFERPTRASLKRLLGTTEGSLSHGGVKGLRRLSKPLGPALRDMAIVAQSAQGTAPHDLSALIAGTAKVTDTLADHDVALGELVSNLNTTAVALSADDGALGDSIGELDRVMRVSPPALTSLDRVLPKLSRFSRTLDPGLVAAPPLLRQLSESVVAFGAIVEPRQRVRVVAALRAAFVDFPDLLTNLTSLVSVVKPVTDCVNTHVTPILNSKLDDGALSTGDPVWQDLAHALPGIASAAQNFDGNGYAVRYQLGVNNQSVSTGSIPGLGTLTGNQPGSSPIAGARPVWVGRLKSSDFRPDAPCSEQPLPNLTARSGPTGLSRSASAGGGR